MCLNRNLYVHLRNIWEIFSLFTPLFLDFYLSHFVYTLFSSHALSLTHTSSLFLFLLSSFLEPIFPFHSPFPAICHSSLVFTLLFFFLISSVFFIFSSAVFLSISPSFSHFLSPFCLFLPLSFFALSYFIFFLLFSRLLFLLIHSSSHVFFFFTFASLLTCFSLFIVSFSLFFIP